VLSQEPSTAESWPRQPARDISRALDCQPGDILEYRKEEIGG
jgi:hypothetical protein